MSLSRFIEAQSGAPGFDAALRELRAGRKRSHWIWYVFPQIAGLGSSPMAVAYGIDGAEEALAYLRNPTLRDRLVDVAEAVADHLRREPPSRLVEIAGSPVDARKIVSSMTLFGVMARRLGAAEPQAALERLSTAADVILTAARAQGLEPCAFTLRVLGA